MKIDTYHSRNPWASRKVRMLTVVAGASTVVLVAAVFWVQQEPDRGSISADDGAAQDSSIPGPASPTTASSWHESRVIADPGEQDPALRPGLSASAHGSPASAMPPQATASELPQASGAGTTGARSSRASGTATVRDGTRSHSLSADEDGRYERLVITPERPVSVRLSYPSHAAGEQVLVEAQDGGSIGDGARGAVAGIDADGGLEFSFTPSAERGMFRVIVRRGADARTLDFWVGETPAFYDRR